MLVLFFFFFKQKTAYEMRISDWSSDVCSSDLGPKRLGIGRLRPRHHDRPAAVGGLSDLDVERDLAEELHTQALGLAAGPAVAEDVRFVAAVRAHEDALVLPYAEHRHDDLADLVEDLAGVAVGAILRPHDY